MFSRGRRKRRQSINLSKSQHIFSDSNHTFRLIFQSRIKLANYCWRYYLNLEDQISVCFSPLLLQHFVSFLAIAHILLLEQGQIIAYIVHILFSHIGKKEIFLLSGVEMILMKKKYTDFGPCPYLPSWSMGKRVSLYWWSIYKVKL